MIPAEHILGLWSFCSTSPPDLSYHDFACGCAWPRPVPDLCMWCFMQAGSGFANLQYVVWPDVLAEALAHLHAHQPHLKVINALDHPLLQASRRHWLPPRADPRVPLDQPHAEAIAQFDWAAAAAATTRPGEESGTAGAVGAKSGRRELTLAERFRCFSSPQILGSFLSQSRSAMRGG